MPSVTKSNVEDFKVKIITWYKANGRTFPWRSDEISDYKLVLTEVLLQRTKAETVRNFYHFFFTWFPTWASISNTPVARLALFLKPLGLYNQRAKRLKMLAAEMIKLKGQFPIERSELDRIPFIGQYIGNAIELLIFKRPKPLLDVNMARVLERYFGERKMADIRFDPYLQRLAHKVTNHSCSKEVNWGILDFAATICVARNPKCQICILHLKCTYFKNRVNFNILA